MTREEIIERLRVVSYNDTGFEFTQYDDMITEFYDDTNSYDVMVYANMVTISKTDGYDTNYGFEEILGIDHMGRFTIKETSNDTV